MYENVPRPTRPSYGLHDPEYRPAGTGGGTGWIWMAGIAVAVLLGLVIFGSVGGDAPTATTPAIESAPATSDPVPVQ